MGDQRLILMGRLAGAFGVRGEMRITAYSAEALALLGYRTLRDAAGEVVLTLTGGRAAKGALIARAAEVPTREAAEALKGLELYVARDDLPAPDKDEVYITDLVGLRVRDEAGADIGRIKSVENFGAGDLLEIAPVDGSPTVWLGFTREDVPELHVAGGYVVARLPASDVTPSGDGGSAPPGRRKRPARPRG